MFFLRELHEVTWEEQWGESGKRGGARGEGGADTVLAGAGPERSGVTLRFTLPSAGRGPTSNSSPWGRQRFLKQAQICRV